MAKHRSIGKKVGIIARYLDMILDSRLAHLGLSAATIPIITFLYENEGVNQDTLAESLQFNKSTAARAVSKLEKEGYLTRTVDPDNRRSNILRTTEKSRSIEEAVNQILKGLTDDVFAGFNDKDIDQYFHLTELISARVLQMHKETK
ncbi:MarR family winged helix-turn-helix transcriptional regulator [Maridesulfovibrio bastinii]|uniref:MarR family winged helix-turn-helix transcriptional regulator n=1 Tax=Maridesulfovibrio bastinii TaxID=47157 RepID=UPI0003FF9B5D|nr:MarR family transcriptional regulator [Maridesulfovibrio bastinii]